MDPIKAGQNLLNAGKNTAEGVVDYGKDKLNEAGQKVAEVAKKTQAGVKEGIIIVSGKAVADAEVITEMATRVNTAVLEAAKDLAAKTGVLFEVPQNTLLDLVKGLPFREFKTSPAVPTRTATATTGAGSTLPPEFQGFVADIKKFGAEVDRIREQLSKTTDPAERAVLFAELQFNMNMMAETAKTATQLLSQLHQDADTILNNIGR